MLLLVLEIQKTPFNLFSDEEIARCRPNFKIAPIMGKNSQNTHILKLKGRRQLILSGSISYFHANDALWLHEDITRHFWAKFGRSKFLSPCTGDGERVPKCKFLPFWSLNPQFSSLDYLIDTIFGVGMVILPTEKLKSKSKSISTYLVQHIL